MWCHPYLRGLNAEVYVKPLLDKGSFPVGSLNGFATGFSGSGCCLLNMFLKCIPYALVNEDKIKRGKGDFQGKLLAWVVL